MKINLQKKIRKFRKIFEGKKGIFEKKVPGKVEKVYDFSQDFYELTGLDIKEDSAKFQSQQSAGKCVKNGHFSGFEELIGYEFKDKNLLTGALKHTSVHGNLFEFLEFLGDRVVGLSVSTLLIKKFKILPKNAGKNPILDKNDREIKDLANNYAKLVSTPTLMEIGRFWQVEKFLQHNIQSLSDKVLADVAEAVLGAIYLDGGFQKASEIVANWWGKLDVQAGLEPKMQLQEFVQSLGLGVPEYETIEVSGPDHQRVYQIQVTAANLGSAIGFGGSKHAASKDAAAKLLAILAKNRKIK